MWPLSLTVTSYHHDWEEGRTLGSGDQIWKTKLRPALRVPAPRSETQVDIRECVDSDSQAPLSSQIHVSTLPFSLIKTKPFKSINSVLNSGKNTETTQPTSLRSPRPTRPGSLLSGRDPVSRSLSPAPPKSRPPQLPSGETRNMMRKYLYVI